MTIEELIKGKETVIKGKEFLSTIKYVQPFLNKVKDVAKRYKVFVKTPDQITDGAITYNRVLIQAYTDKVVEGYTECICFAYALDTRKPMAKYYKCFIDENTDIMMISNKMGQGIVEIEPEEVIDMSGFNNVMSLDCYFSKDYNLLSSVKYAMDNTDLLLGTWVKNSLISEYKTPFGKVKLSSSNVIDAYKSMFLDSDSQFSNNDFSQLDVFEAIGKIIASDTKDFINKFEKTSLITTII